MLAATEEPAVLARMHPISVDTYHRLGEMGHLSERTELIRGVITDQMPRSPLHSTIVRLLDKHLLLHLPSGWHPRAEQPLTLPDSEPEPDIAAVAGTEADYFAQHPRTAALVIEVCGTSEDLDRVKLGLYVEAGVPEAWLVLAGERIVERHTEPRDGAYRCVERAIFPATLASTIFPNVILPSKDLFGTAH